MELDVQWQEHDLGSYSLTILVWEDTMRGVAGVYREV